MAHAASETLRTLPDANASVRSNHEADHDLPAEWAGNDMTEFVQVGLFKISSEH